MQDHREMTVGEHVETIYKEGWRAEILPSEHKFLDENKYCIVRNKEIVIEPVRSIQWQLLYEMQNNDKESYYQNAINFKDED